MNKGQKMETTGSRPMNWYCVQTNPQAERKADGELRRAGLRVYLPKRSYEVRNRRDHDNTTVRFRPLLIGYLFIRFPEAMYDSYGNPQFGIVRACQGVKGYVRVANEIGEWEPIAVPDQDIASFMRRQRSREFGRPAVVNPRKRFLALKETFRRGAQHKVTDGPFAGFLATLERLNENLTLDGEVSIMGRSVKVNIGISDVEAVPQRVAA